MRLVPAITLLFFHSSLFGGKPLDQQLELESPDGTVSARIDTAFNLEIKRSGKLVLPASPIGIIVNGSELGQGVEILATEPYRINENYPWNGNHSEVQNQCNGTIYLLSTNGQIWTLDLRAYNDGVAFKF